MRASRHGAGGFTLIEVLMAFVVFAISVAVVLQILASSSRGTLRARQDTEVAMIVQSVMDVVGSDIPLEPGSWSGDMLDGYRWDVDIQPLDDGAAAGELSELAMQSGIELYRVHLEVRWDTGLRERSEIFTTIRGRTLGAQAP